jgi:hypothetical protein
MKFAKPILFAAVMALTAGAGLAQARPISDAAIRQVMIRESLASYPGNCPCPYNTDRAGRSCGRRSAYSRPGGYAPLCYASDISKSQVDEYRRNHGLSAGAR